MEVKMNFLQKLWNELFKKDEVNPKCCDAHKRSLHIGINDYPGRQNDLKGCVNDARGWQKYLTQHKNFHTVVLLDNKATYKNVKRELEKLVKWSHDGCHAVITFSGHGTNVRDVSGDEEDKRDEALCLYDRLLIDDELRAILKGFHEGTVLTFISDSCHSGTVTRAFLDTMSEDDAPKPRYLPPVDEEEILDLSPSSVSKKIMSPQENMNEVLITGCKSTEYSYDARFGGKPMGAMSYHALRILKENSTPLSYDDFYTQLRAKLPQRRYPQTPQLEGSEENRGRKMFS
jgi:hypothetical protein